ncbi:Hint domain-containing protein [Aliiroseovarius sediminis]|uniref:Hint domain-containing protein n=1 Tax=Aliiroseovarius sediminis TaxID=2925839 RepID=UPI001F58CCC1|nr:Hint domain-containing protein [Aliiroseovarius sediminis]MCI2393397.1 Hint domain-containing protein [Aliiroseovarius sediminis]
MTPNPFHGDVVAGQARGAGPTAGIGPGALVRTLHGDRAVETLGPGDQIITSDGRKARLDAITCHIAPARMLCRISPKTQTNARAHAGPVILSNHQHVMVEGWMARAMFGRDQALVPVSAIADGELIRRMDLDAELPLFQLHFYAPQLVCVGGLTVLATPARQPATVAARYPAS